MEVEGAYAQMALDRLLRSFNPSTSDRGLATQLVYGTLKSRGTLDWVLAQLSKRPLASLNPWVLQILRLGAYQLLFLERVPQSAACHQAVELAKHHVHSGAAGFVNGVLRSLLRLLEHGIAWPELELDPSGYLEVVESHPRWLIERWLQRYGVQATLNLCQFNNMPAAQWLRVNTMKIEPDDLISQWAKDGHQVERSRWLPEGLRLLQHSAWEDLPGFKAGWFIVQGESSMLVARAMAPPPAATVLDACAAPGGKSTHLAQLMGDRGNVIALDIHAHRLQLLQVSCQRLGISSVETVTGDAREAGTRWPNHFDCVLVDAPCSGSGVLSRRPDLRWRQGPEKLTELVQLQRQILEGVAGCVQPGGILVYSTCSLEPEENEQVIQWFLEQYREFRRDPLVGNTFNWPPGEVEGQLQMLPQVHATEGFFIARLRRQQ